MERSIHLHPPSSSSSMDSKQSSNMVTPLSAALLPSDDNLASSGHPVGELQHVSTIVGLHPVLSNSISVNPVAQQSTAAVLTSPAMPISGYSFHGQYPIMNHVAQSSYYNQSSNVYYVMNTMPIQHVYSGQPPTNPGKGQGCDHGSQPQCQLCGELGHIVHTCSKRFDASYTGVTTPGPSFPSQNLSAHLSYTGPSPPLRTHPYASYTYAPNLSFPPPIIPQTPIHYQSPSVNFSFPSSSQPHDQGGMSYPTAGTVTYAGLSTMSCPPMCVFQADEGSTSIPNSTIPGDSFSPYASVHPPTVSQPTGTSQQVPHSPAVPFPSAPTGATNHITNASLSMTHTISYNGSDPMDRMRKSENNMTDMVGPKRQNLHEVLVSAHCHGYEVFLSFNGNDTRKGFTSQLYQQMVDAGISVFKDNVNLPYGKEICTSLSQAIEMSKIAIPILSNNYGASRWCLDELICMLECRNARKQTVLPIFYDVTPSQVRHQMGNYVTAKADEETVEKWRKALTEITTLKGLELEKETGGDEGQLTKMVVGKVLVELKRSHLQVSAKLVGINDQGEEIKNLLAIEAKDMRKVVGLWGMGGIGKTTLAKFIYNQILDKFESCSFLRDIREKSLEHSGLEHLQSRLVSNLSKKDRRHFSCIDEGVNNLEVMFRMKKVLILLDDVDNINQLEALAAKPNWFGPGSRIIVTTRNKSILDDWLGLSNDKDITQEYWWSCYEVQELNQKKSLQLFCMHAFRQDDPEHQFSVLSHAIVETTGGLPLALEVIGSFLARKRKSIWEEILEKLRKMPKEEVQERLKISYDRLNDDQKQMFLDVACLLIGEDVDVMVHIWKDRGFWAEPGKDALVLMSLIKIVNNKFCMHDQLRDLGREIVRKESYKELGKRTRVWDANDGRAAITYISSSSKVEALHLHKDLNRDNCITSEHLRRYMNIWFLKLDGVNLTGNFQDLLPKLRWLMWECSSKEIYRFDSSSWNCPPTNLNLKELLFLDLSLSCVTSDGKLWRSFQNSKKLKFLNLNSCSRLTTLDVSMFINLERLVLRTCGLLKQVSVEKLERLIFLNMAYCIKLQEIEGLDQLEALEELTLRGCKAIEKLPAFSKLKSLKRLYFGWCSKLQDIEGLDQLEALEELTLHAIAVGKLPTLSKLKSLKRLDFGRCSKFEEIEGLDQLEALEELKLRNCIAIEKLPTLSKLKSLKRLDFGRCSKFEEIEGLDQLEALEELKLRNCIAIEKLPTLSKLKSLKILDFGWCSKLQEIEGLDQLEALEELTLLNCIAIEKLSTLSKLKSLKRLNFDLYSKLQEIEGLDQLEALEELTLLGCKAIDKSPTLSKLKSLKRLNFDRCLKLQEIEGLDQLEALEELKLYYCTAIEKLPTLSKLKSLKRLNFGWCSKLQEIEGLDQLEALEELTLFGCKAIEKLPTLSKLKSLKRLNFDSCSKLQEIEELDQLEALEELRLHYCIAIEKLPTLSKLKSLKRLNFDCCLKLQEIEGLDQLEALEELKLYYCEAIEKLPTLSKLKSLKRLNFDWCLKLQEIEGLDQLEALEKLRLSGCIAIEKLPPIFLRKFGLSSLP